MRVRVAVVLAHVLLVCGQYEEYNHLMPVRGRFREFGRHLAYHRLDSGQRRLKLFRFLRGGVLLRCIHVAPANGVLSVVRITHDRGTRH